jgi:hypothetical protein
MKYTKEDKEDFLKVLDSSLGIVKTACNKYGIARQTYYDWLKDDWFKAEVKNVKRSRIDFAETALFKNIKKGKEASIIFFLKTQGKDDGYSERFEHTGADGGAIVWQEEKTYIGNDPKKEE